MAKFKYKAKKGLNDVVEGTIEAQSHDDVLNKLFDEGLFPISIETFSAKSADKRPGPKSIKTLLRKHRRRINFHQILVFTQKLAILMRAKVELLSSLKIIYEQTENPAFQEIILEIYNATREGKSFSDSLGRFPQIFSSLYVNIVRSGEASGALDSALDQITHFLSRQGALRTKVAVALAYPALLLTVGLASIFVLINFVVPRLKPIFANLGEDLPFITKIVLQISEISNHSWLIILAGLFIFFSRAAYSAKGKLFLQRLVGNLKIKTPLVKDIIKNQELAIFSQSLSLLLKRGVPALRALEIVTPSINNLKLRKELEQVFQDVAAGGSMSRSIESSTNLPAFFTKMIAVGEESGRLAEVLDEISSSYNQQVEANIAVLNSLLEPALILFLGLILGGIVLAILIPTFQVTQIVH